jgi:mono/diheme cytochrome c family protein
MRRSLALGLALALAGLPAGAQAQRRIDVLPGDYRVVNGRVDSGTYLGWRLFHSACYGCHGVDARGTDLAPNLVERVKSMTPRAFAAKVLTSYRLVQTPAETDADERNAGLEALLDRVMRQERVRAGEIVMPAWDDNPRVSPHVLDLYAYLSARADGQLGPGRPARIGRK